MSDRSTVSPPRPESKTPIGRHPPPAAEVALIARRPRGPLQPVGDGGADPRRVGRDGEDDVETAAVGVAQARVENARVLSRVDRGVEHDDRRRARRAGTGLGGGGRAEHPTRSPAATSAAARAPRSPRSTTTTRAFGA